MFLPRSPRSRRSRPTVEALEERRLPSVYTVTTKADGGSGSLRQAIVNANGNPGADTIRFAIGTGSQVISLASALPAITGPVVLDATTQPGYAGVPLIELTGGNAGAGANGLTITGGGSTVMGLHIDHFAGDGIDLATNGGNTITGNYLGTANGANGILVTSAGNTIGGTAAGAGNVISGNTGNGVELSGSAASGNVVLGNLIGTAPSGQAALANGGRGVFIDGAPNNTIGGTTAAARNVLSGNSGVDVLVDNGAASNVVEGNTIGLTADGTGAVSSTGGGVRIGNAADNNTIGGTAAGAGNVISGNVEDGVLIDDWNGDTSTYSGVAGAGNAILGNTIGLNAAGTAAVPNGTDGVQFVHGAANNFITGNVISGNAGDGIVLSDAGTNGNTIQGNVVGLDPAGSTARGNGRHGLEIINGAASNLVGTGNVISGNSLSGIYLNGTATSGNAIRGNFIGTNAAGTAALGNGSQGHLTLDEQGIKVEGAGNDTIGGTAAGAGNVIAGNAGNGIFLAAGTTGVVIQGNFIGTNAAGAANLGNGADGVRIDASFGNTVGGTATGAGNVLSGNGGNGITVLDHVGGATPFTPGTNDPGGLTLTAAGVAAGFTLSTFIDQFPSDGSTVGPLGMTFPTAGGFLTTDLGNIHQFTADRDNQSVSAAAKTTDYGKDNTLGLATDGSAVYLAQSANHRVLRLNSDGTAGPVLVSGPAGSELLDLVTDPANGHLFLSTGSGGDIYDINPLVSPATATVFASGLRADGLTITPDGSTLYVSNSDASTDTLNQILAYDVATKTQKSTFPPTTVSGSDGVTLGSGALAGYLFVNTHYGKVVMMSAADPSIQTVIASGGSRGDFAIVDPANDTILLTQTDRIERLTFSARATTTANVIEGNLVGTNGAGTAALPNAGDGIDVLGGAFTNTIGGAAAGAGNVISGNAGDGIHISGNPTLGNVLQGNLIGTVPSGLVPLGNVGYGVFIDGAPTNTVGGTTAQARNVIAGNGTGPNAAGVLIANSGATGNVVEGNYLGVAADGTTTAGMGNAGPGVCIGNRANDNAVGGTAAGAGNVIGPNGGYGVLVDDFDGVSTFTGVAGVGNPIRGNVFVNVTPPNQSIGLLNGGNHALAAPVLATAITSGGATTVTGSLSGPANTSFVVEFFSSAAASPPQGQTFLGQLTLTTDGTGQKSFTAPLPVAVTPGEFIAATATNTATNDSSGFSVAVAVQQVLAFTSVPSAAFTVGTLGGFTVAATGFSPPTLSESGGDVLPNGVTFTAATGVLSGTPLAGSGAVYPLHFTAHNGYGPDVTQTFTLTVNEAAAITSAGSTTFTAGTLGSVTVTLSGFPVPTLSESAGDTLPGGVTFNAATGVLSGTPAAGSGGSYPLHFTAHNGIGADAAQAFTLAVDQAPAFTSAAGAGFVAGTLNRFTVSAGGFPLPALSESSSDTLPGGVTFDPGTGVLSGTPPAGSTGSYTLHFTATNGVGSDATLTFTLTVGQSPAITSAGSTTFTAGTAGSFTVSATGSPAPTLSESGSDVLPGGVTFNPANGVLGGTPAAGGGGVYTLHFSAHNGIGTDATQTFTLTVDAAPAFTSAAGAAFTAGAAGAFTVSAGGFPAATLSESAGDTLPAGVTFNAATGVLSGTPAGPGSYTLHFTATNGVGADATETFALTVVAPPSPPPPPSGQPAPLPPRGISAHLVVVKVGKKKRLAVEVDFADTGAKKSQFTLPYQRPRYAAIQVSVRDSNADGVPDEVVVTARKGRRTVTATYPG